MDDKIVGLEWIENVERAELLDRKLIDSQALVQEMYCLDSLEFPLVQSHQDSSEGGG